MKSFLILSALIISNLLSAQSLKNISGQVKQANGNPLAGASVTLLNSGKGAVTKADGSFSINGLPQGIYLVNVSAAGFAAAVDTADLNKDNAVINITLSPSYANLDEVVVSAEKLEEKIQRIPSAVSAFNARQVGEFRLWNVNQLSGLVPNLYSANSGDYRNVTSIRGITTTSYEQAVATYVDGVSQFNLDTYIPQLFDVERIEILRGPQGTLYGRNAMGGVVNIITKKPQNKLDAYTEISVGDYGQHRIGASLKVPIIADKLFFGAAGLYDQRKGYYTNVFNNTDFDRQKQITGNYYLKFYPVANFHAVANFKHQNNRNNGPFPLAPDKTAAFEAPFQVNQNATTTMHDDNINASLALHYDPAGFRLTSLTAWQSNYRFYNTPIDGDFSPLDAVAIVNNYGKEYNKVNVLTQELRIQSREGSKLKWTGGAYFFKQKSPTKQGTYFGKDAGLLGIPDTEFTLINLNKGENTGMAVYGQMTYPLSDRLELTVGLRYDNEKRKLTVAGEYQKDPDPAFPVLADTSASQTFSAFSPKAGIQYNMGSENMVYLSYSRGYRAGGLTSLGSDPSQVPLSVFDPEYSNNVELGWKNFLLNRRLRLNAAIFYSFVDNVQVPTLVLPDAITVVRNSGKMTSKGMEMEISATPVNGLELMFNGGFTDASYSTLSLPKDGAMVNYDGNKQVFSPAYTSLLMAQYSHPLGKSQKAKIVARLEWISFGKQYFDLANTISQDPYSLLHTRIGISTSHAELYIWGRNLGNEKYIAYGYDFGGVHLGNPKTIGTTLILKL